MAKPDSKQSERAAKAERLLVVSRERKALEKEEDALKAFFKKDCAGASVVYEVGSVVIETGVQERVGLDTERVRADHGEKYDKRTTFMTVVAREKQP